MSFVSPVLIVIASWWIGTGVVLYLQQRIESTQRTLTLSLIATAVFAIVGLHIGGSGDQTWHSYTGFVAAIALWGCIELSYYTGLVSGVHKRVCPANCKTGKRFRLALGASIWHEISALLVGGLVIALLLQEKNPAGLYTFLVLWLMRWSAKLNLFFGVPNFNTDWFPKRLAYAHSYIRRAPVTWFFPVSVFSAALVAYLLIQAAVSSPPERALMLILPGVLLLLAILEHLFMALPIADTQLWDRIFAQQKPTEASSDSSADGTSQKSDNIASLDGQASPQRPTNRALTVSTNRPLSVTLKTVEATANRSVSQ